VYPKFECFIHVKVDYEKKGMVFPIKNFTSLVLARNAILHVLQYLHVLSSFCCIMCKLVTVRTLTTKEKAPSGCGCLQEVVAFMRFQR